MSEWHADWANDPYNDFELTLEILYGDQDIGVIKQGKNGIGLELILFPHDKNLVIPFDWLLELMKDADTSIPHQ